MLKEFYFSRSSCSIKLITPGSRVCCLLGTAQSFGLELPKKRSHCLLVSKAVNVIFRSIIVRTQSVRVFDLGSGKNCCQRVGQGLPFVIYLFIPVFLARLHEVQKSYCSHPGRTRSRSRSTLLKFSRSLYLGNHSSESIHTWTIGTQ